MRSIYGKIVLLTAVSWCFGNLSMAQPTVNVQIQRDLLVHGTLDPVVPLEQSVLMRDALKAANVAVDLVALEGAGHGWPINSPFGQQALARVVPFFERHLK